MKFLMCLTFLAIATAIAEECTSEVCDRTKGCVCTSNTSPIDPKETPQFVVLSIDDAINPNQVANFYKGLSARKNPDGNQITATFFIPHEYTDYSVVNALYNQGYEIAINSISKSTTDYWSKADEALLLAEFQGQKQIISKFANIPQEKLIGARIPQFQLAGNKLFKAYQTAGIQYDSSWPSRSSNKLFPYTLEFDSTQECLIGQCPTESFKDIWVVPINNIQGNNSVECNVLFGCGIEGTAEEISQWLIEEFNTHYEEDRAPFHVLVNSGYFQFVENGLEGFNLFLDHLATIKEVFIVSESQVIDWMKNPVPLGEYATTVSVNSQPCEKQTCHPKHTDGNERWMTVCTTCPKKFPWVNNPEGK